MGFAVGAFSKYSNSVMLGIETIERMSTRARIRKKKKKKWHNRIIPHNIYIHMCKTEQWNKWAGSRVKSHRQRETEKEEEEDSSQPKTCAHLIVTSISSKQTYREVSAVCASKKPGGNAWRELSITLRVVFESNINVFVTKKMQSSETIVSLGDSMHRCQYNEIPPLFPFHFIPPPP